MGYTILCLGLCLFVLVVGMNAEATAADDKLHLQEEPVVPHEMASPSPFATCDGCYCIPPLDDPCPSQTQPRFNYSAREITIMRAQTLKDPLGLTCNPYLHHGHNKCQTSPPQNATLVQLGNTAMCGIQYDDPAAVTTSRRRLGTQQQPLHLTHNVDCPTHYTLQTYPTLEEAKRDGAQVTHAGACGVCSTLQDLAAYIEHTDLAGVGTKCSAEALVSFQHGLDCYKRHGFTEDCSRMWVYNGYQTSEECLAICVKSRMEKEPNNGPAPLCQLNHCLTCDERKSGPLFKAIAGRSRRRSGLLSNIVRTCDEIFHFAHHDPCPEPRVVD